MIVTIINEVEETETFTFNSVAKLCGKMTEMSDMGSDRNFGFGCFWQVLFGLFKQNLIEVLSNYYIKKITFQINCFLIYVFE